jgi:L-threonylcarbamoyladenylate synthase
MQEDIKKSFETLQSGGTILYPTDTIWGIGCDATNANAIKKIFTIKKRSEGVPFIVLVDSVAMLERYVETVPEIAYQLIEVATNPLTIIYPKAKNIAKNLIAADGSIGIRVTKDEFCSRLIDLYKKPIVSTSANIAGQKSPLGFFDISNEIKLAVDFIVPLHLEELSSSKSSDIIKVSKSGQIEVLR